MVNWAPLRYETLKWENISDLQYLSRKSRSKILPTYESSLPNTIFDKNVILTPELDGKISDLMINISRFDLIQSQKGFSFPSVLLRSESAASSQIENLTSSIKNIALAELSTKVPQNAQLVARNVRAMRSALKTPEILSIPSILNIYKILMFSAQDSWPGDFRKEAVWIGGTSYSPHEAIFVPPHHSRIGYYMNDLISYSNRTDLNPIVKAAIIHAQFETIHPFIDGNGRTGRTLIHKSLKDDGVLKEVALPISAGLLNNTSKYMDSLISFQEGNPMPIIEEIFKALESSLIVGEKASQNISLIIEKWMNTIEEKASSSIWKFLYLLVEQPVVNSTYISNKLGISIRGANKLIDRAIDYGCIRRIGNKQRDIFYQADDIIAVMDEISDLSILRRI